MHQKRLVNLVIYILVILSPLTSFSLRESQPLAVDKRLRVMVYNPNDVFKFTGFYGYESSIVFATGEQIDTITLGDSIAWQIVPNGNRIFLKPVEHDAVTNMTVITDRRVYHFELHAQDAKDISDPDLIFSMKFLYPDEDGGGAIQHFADNTDPENSSKTLNYKYSISGPESISPVKIFDDGNFTYFQFSSDLQELPAIFIVYSDNTEGIINYRISGKYMVVERIAPKFTLRLGKTVGCVFNEKLSQKKMKKVKKLVKKAS